MRKIVLLFFTMGFVLLAKDPTELFNKVATGETVTGTTYVAGIGFSADRRVKRHYVQVFQNDLFTHEELLTLPVEDSTICDILLLSHGEVLLLFQLDTGTLGVTLLSSGGKPVEKWGHGGTQLLVAKGHRPHLSYDPISETIRITGMVGEEIEKYGLRTVIHAYRLAQNFLEPDATFGKEGIQIVTTGISTVDGVLHLESGEMVVVGRRNAISYLHDTDYVMAKIDASGASGIHKFTIRPRHEETIEGYLVPVNDGEIKFFFLFTLKDENFYVSDLLEGKYNETTIGADSLTPFNPTQMTTAILRRPYSETWGTLEEPPFVAHLSRGLIARARPGGCKSTMLQIMMGR